MYKNKNYKIKEYNATHNEIRLMFNTEFKRRIQKMNLNNLNNLLMIFVTRGMLFSYLEKWNILVHHYRTNYPDTYKEIFGGNNE